MSQITFPTNTTTLLVNTLNANKIVYLPAISTVNAGTVYYIKDICGNAAASSIYVYAAGSDTIERQNTNSAAAVINTNFGSVMLSPDGINNWMVLQHYSANVITKLWKTTPPAPSLSISYTPPNTYLYLSWAQVPSTASYSIIAYTNTTPTTVGSSVFQTFPTYTNTFFAFTTNALTQNYYYYFTATATNPLGSSTATSAIIQATLYPLAPTNPSIGFVYPTITATWTASSLATSYVVIFYNSTTATASGGTTFQIITGVSGTSQTNTITLVNGNFYATIIAVNAYGYSAAATSSTVLVSLPPPGTASASISFSFPNAATPPTFTCTWAAVATASTYTVIFYESVSPATSGGTTFQTFTLVPTTTQISSTIPVNTYYYYATVTSVNPFGSSSPVTTTNYVQALTQAAATSSASIIFSFPNAATPPTFTCSWFAAALTASYTVIFYQTATPPTTGGTIFQTFTGVTGTSQVSSTIPVNTNYYYATVTSVNAYVNSSPVTTSGSVQAITFPPVVTSVAVSFYFPTSSSTPAIQCTWSPVATAATYTIIFYQSVTPTTTSGTTFQTISGNSGTSQITSTTILNNYYYYATITSVNAYGTSAAVTSSSFTQATFVPSISSASISFSSNQVTASWIASPYAATFTVVFYQVATQTTTGGSILETITGVTSTSQTSITPLADGQYYYAIVTATNIYGTSSPVTTSNAVQNVLFTFTSPLTFTPAGATGQYGPTLSQCRTAYASFGAWVNTSYFNMTTQGNQLWTVPQTKNYTIVCAGAGNGNGAILTATFNLVKAHILNIVVGQLGTSKNGNGGTYIYNTTTSSFLIISGGSGGGGEPASLTINGTSGTGAISPGGGGVNGSSGGNGGSSFNSVNIGNGVCGGNDGLCPSATYPNYSIVTWNNRGGVGGSGLFQSTVPYNSSGATFGGGGSFGNAIYTRDCRYFVYQYTPFQGCVAVPVFTDFSPGGAAGGGGGGGYSGGGGGGVLNATNLQSGGGNGGGGGSYCSVTLTSSSVTNNGNGYVSITA